MYAALFVLILAADVDPEPRAAKKVAASVDWYSVRNAGPLQRTPAVLRSPAELLAAMPLLGDRSTSEKDKQTIASAAAVKALGVRSIDWKRQVLIVAAAG